MVLIGSFGSFELCDVDFPNIGQAMSRNNVFTSERTVSPLRWLFPFGLRELNMKRRRLQFGELLAEVRHQTPNLSSGYVQW